MPEDRAGPPTHFLSAQRTAPPVLAAEIARAAVSPLVTAVLDASGSAAAILDLNRQVIACKRRLPGDGRRDRSGGVAGPAARGGARLRARRSPGRRLRHHPPPAPTCGAALAHALVPPRRPAGRAPLRGLGEPRGRGARPGVQGPRLPIRAGRHLAPPAHAPGREPGSSPRHGGADLHPRPGQPRHRAPLGGGGAGHRERLPHRGGGPAAGRAAGAAGPAPARAGQRRGGRAVPPLEEGAGGLGRAGPAPRGGGAPAGPPPAGASTGRG